MEVLIVDDERFILQGLKACIEAIEDVSCHVRTARDGRQALTLLEAAPVDLMITDIEMPSCSGLELIEKAQKRRLYKKCVVLSGYDKFEYAQSAIRFGVKDYLLKPFDRDDLVRNIRAAAAELGDVQKLNLMKRFDAYLPHVIQQEPPYPLRRYYQYMKENYSQSISLKMLADHYGKSEGSLCSLFKKEWNTTFLELINEMRLQRAIYLLLYEPGLTVEEIAVQVGYQTERQLFRLLKNRLDMTPQQVRHTALSEEAT
ncbi:MAG: response regulator [Clostridia bacterium]|nr:response regulator [Clostridia bacterium]